jgi:hypothetical protein
MIQISVAETTTSSTSVHIPVKMIQLTKIYFRINFFSLNDIYHCINYTHDSKKNKITKYIKITEAESEDIT